MEQSRVQLPEWTRVAEVEHVYKTKIKASERPNVNSSRDIFNIIREFWDQKKIDMKVQGKRLTGCIFQKTDS